MVTENHCEQTREWRFGSHQPQGIPIECNHYLLTTFHGSSCKNTVMVKRPASFREKKARPSHRHTSESVPWLVSSIALGSCTLLSLCPSVLRLCDPSAILLLVYRDQGLLKISSFFFSLDSKNSMSPTRFQHYIPQRYNKRHWPLT